MLRDSHDSPLVPLMATSTQSRSAFTSTFTILFLHFLFHFTSPFPLAFYFSLLLYFLHLLFYFRLSINKPDIGDIRHHEQAFCPLNNSILLRDWQQDITASPLQTDRENTLFHLYKKVESCTFRV